MSFRRRSRYRRLARLLNHQRTLPGRLLRELRWARRDLQDLHAELKRLLSLTPPEPHPYQSEMTDKDIAHRGF